MADVDRNGNAVVRCVTPSGGRATLREGLPEVFGWQVVDEPAVDAQGVILPDVPGDWSGKAVAPAAPYNTDDSADGGEGA